MSSPVVATEPVDPIHYDVQPDEWKIVEHPRFGSVVVAMMPYPVPKGEDAEDPACLNDEAWTDDDLPPFRSHALRYMRQTCERCPFTTECREYGIAHEVWGMWGGTTPTERTKMRKARRQMVVEPHVSYVYGFTPEWSVGLITKAVTDAESQAD